MAIWQKEEGNIEPTDKWFLNLLKQCGFDARQVVDNGSSLFVECNDLTIHLREKCVEIIGDIPGCVELNLLKRSFQNRGPHQIGVLRSDSTLFRGLANQLVVTTMSNLSDLGIYFKEHALSRSSEHESSVGILTEVGSLA